MFTIKVNSVTYDGEFYKSKTQLFKCDIFTKEYLKNVIYVWGINNDGSIVFEAEIPKEKKHQDEPRVDECLYESVIVENSSGKTTEVIKPTTLGLI